MGAAVATSSTDSSSGGRVNKNSGIIGFTRLTLFSAGFGGSFGGACNLFTNYSNCRNLLTGTSDGGSLHFRFKFRRTEMLGVFADIIIINYKPELMLLVYKI